MILIWGNNLSYRSSSSSTADHSHFHSQKKTLHAAIMYPTLPTQTRQVHKPRHSVVCSHSKGWVPDHINRKMWLLW